MFHVLFLETPNIYISYYTYRFRISHLHDGFVVFQVDDVALGKSFQHGNETCSKIRKSSLFLYLYIFACLI